MNSPEHVQRAFVACLRARLNGARVSLGDAELAERWGIAVIGVENRFWRSTWTVGEAVVWATEAGVFTGADVMALSNATWRLQ